MDDDMTASKAGAQVEPAISVVLATHDMASYLDEAITSVRGGDFNDFELLIIDDGSTDDTRSVVEQFTKKKSAQFDPRIRYFYQENAGKPAALNSVSGNVRGDYIAILDADDQLPREGLSRRYQPIKKSKQKPPDLVIGGFEVFRNGSALGERQAPVHADIDTLRRQFLFNYKTPFHLNSCLIARGLMRRVGEFDSNLIRAQDQDYSLRLLAAAENVCVVDAIVYRYRKYRSTFTERVRYRVKNLCYRSQMISKHTCGVERLAAVAFGAALDLGKMAYELGGAYHN